MLTFTLYQLIVPKFIVVQFNQEELVKEKPSKRFIRQGENSGYLVVS